MKQIFELLGQWNSITVLLIVLSFIILSIVKTKGLFWYIKQLIGIYSDTPSFFSKKRFESGQLFNSALLILLSYDYIHRYTITHYEVISQVVLLLGAAGYVLDKIQKEKLTDKPDNKLDEAAK